MANICFYLFLAQGPCTPQGHKKNNNKINNNNNDNINTNKHNNYNIAVLEISQSLTLKLHWTPIANLKITDYLYVSHLETSKRAQCTFNKYFNLLFICF